jgi:DUF1365 family protein
VVRGHLVTTTSDDTMTPVVGLPTLPAIVPGRVAHRRHHPVRHAFHHRLDLWLVDLDRFPRLPWYLRPFASFDARDHLGGTAGGTEAIAANVRRFLLARGVDLGPQGRVLMLANARVLGHVFDPLTVFWCFRTDGSPGLVVAEVHNTYGERHAYLLAPDADGRVSVDKRLYVSPFNDVTGTYDLRFALDHDGVRVDVALRRQDSVVFDAHFSGRPRPATRTAVALAALRSPAMPQRVSALIRLHGAWLWLRRLPVVPRPVHPPQEEL